MSGDVPGSTPEGQLIRRVRDLSVPKLSIRAAAERIGLSPEQWGYIERGYRPAGAGQSPKPFSPPAATLAKMAHALRIPPERLESEGQRPDAAEILVGILRHEANSVPAPGSVERRPPMTDPARAAAARPYEAAIWERIANYITDHPGVRAGDIPGKDLFGNDPLASTWDDPGLRENWRVSNRVWLAADLQAQRACRQRRAEAG